MSPQLPQSPQRPRDAVESIVRANGCALFGVARLDGVSDASGDVSLDGLQTGISFGYRLSDAVLDGMADHPTRTYQYHYRQVNLLLDHTGLLVAAHLHHLGHRAFPVPASQIVDWTGLKGHVSHKAVGRLAGLGWIGRNNLLVNPRFGARVRYATVLTDLALDGDLPVEDGCGTCRLCAGACPGGAIGDTREDFDLGKCIATIEMLRKSENIGSQICGLCVKACRGRA